MVLFARQLAEPNDAEPKTARLTVDSDGAFALRVDSIGRQSDFAVEEGKNEFLLK